MTCPSRLIELCSVARDHITDLLSTRDLLHLSTVCWGPDCHFQLRKRQRAQRLRGEGVIVVSEEAPDGASREVLDNMFREFIEKLGRHWPLLALIYVDKVFDPWRRLDLASLFPEDVAVIKLQFQITADLVPYNERTVGLPCMQAVLITRPSREDLIKPKFINCREYDDNTYTMFLLDEESVKDIEDIDHKQFLFNDRSSFVLTFEITTEMMIRASILSQSRATAAYGINFVTTSHIPQNLAGKKIKFQGLRKIKKTFLNGFVLSGPSLWTNSLVVDSANWRTQLDLINFSQTVFTFVVIPQKTEASLLAGLDQELLPRIPSNKILLLRSWSHRFSIPVENPVIQRVLPRMVEEVAWLRNMAEEDDQQILRKIHPKEEVLVIQMDISIWGKQEECDGDEGKCDVGEDKLEGGYDVLEEGYDGGEDIHVDLEQTMYM